MRLVFGMLGTGGRGRETHTHKAIRHCCCCYWVLFLLIYLMLSLFSANKQRRRKSRCVTVIQCKLKYMLDSDLLLVKLLYSIN